MLPPQEQGLFSVIFCSQIWSKCSECLVCTKPVKHWEETVDWSRSDSCFYECILQWDREARNKQPKTENKQASMLRMNKKAQEILRDKIIWFGGGGQESLLCDNDILVSLGGCEDWPERSQECSMEKERSSGCAWRGRWVGIGNLS